MNDSEFNAHLQSAFMFPSSTPAQEKCLFLNVGMLKLEATKKKKKGGIWNLAGYNFYSLEIGNHRTHFTSLLMPISVSFKISQIFHFNRKCYVCFKHSQQTESRDHFSTSSLHMKFSLGLDSSHAHSSFSSFPHNKEKEGSPYKCRRQPKLRSWQILSV